MEGEKKQCASLSECLNGFSPPSPRSSAEKAYSIFSGFLDRNSQAEHAAQVARSDIRDHLGSSDPEQCHIRHISESGLSERSCHVTWPMHIRRIQEVSSENA